MLCFIVSFVPGFQIRQQIKYVDYLAAMPILHAVVELSTNLELRKVWDHESFPHIEMVEKHDGYDTVYWQVLLIIIRYLLCV